MRVPKVHTIDFETFGIMEGRPTYPPEPVGVSIRKAGQRKARYYAWGHPTNNNCTREEGRRALLEVWEDSHTALLFHNAKFDYDVATTRLGLPELPWERIHDTLFLLFLFDPHGELSLKPASEKHLGMPPEEQDMVREWLIEQKIVPRSAKRSWGAHIWQAPGDLVGKYADGDVDRTLRLFRHFYPKLGGMKEAYDVERELMMQLLDSERQGVHVHLPELERDYEIYTQAMERVEQWLRRRLKAPGLNFNAKDDVGDALHSSGVVTDWVLTKTGKRSTSKDNLTFDRFNDKNVARALDYRNRLQTILGTFMGPWLQQARETGGWIYTTWNQVRTSHAAGTSGVRTGRISSSGPNLANIPKEFRGFVLPTNLRDLPPLPMVRRYIAPDPGHVFLSRDYSQQELRILAHYIEGPFLQAYRANPRMDAHAWTQEQIESVIQRAFNRDQAKIQNFADLYGMGTGLQAQRLGTDVKTVLELKKAKRQAMLGLEDLEAELWHRAKLGEPFRTWGGRVYYCEEPKFSPEYRRVMTYEYKMLNYLIQGSAADCTKRAILRYNAARKDSRFLIQVYDEINISAPKGAMKQEMKILREAMESVEFDVPMLSEGEYGPNWHDLVPFPEEE